MSKSQLFDSNNFEGTLITLIKEYIKHQRYHEYNLTNLMSSTNQLLEGLKRNPSFEKR
jgi:hypothetical protein